MLINRVHILAFISYFFISSDESEDSADEAQAGYTLYPLSDKSTWQPKPKTTVNKSNSKKDEKRENMVGFSCTVFVADGRAKKC